ncbi:MAG: hypothetical protein AAFP76_03940 [Bacteroidota bacterium]
MNEQRLPGESTITTLWIISLILIVTGFCCGIFSTFPALVISIIGLRMANRNTRLFHSDPTNFLATSQSAVNTGKVIHIIALVISAVITLVYLVFFMFYGALLGSLLWAGWNADQFDDFDSNYDDSWNEQVIESWEEPEDSLEERTWVVDSIKVDSSDY